MQGFFVPDSCGSLFDGSMG